MVTLAIFDPKFNRRSQIAAMLQHGLPEHISLSLRIAGFSSQWDLLDCAKRQPFDLYILDVGDPIPVGLKIAEELRCHGDRSYILFISNTPEHALAAFDVRAHHYFVRPVDDFRFCSTVEEIMILLLSTQKQVVTVKTHSATEHIRPEEILYAELVGRAVRYNLLSGRKLETVTMRVNFAEAVAPLLKEAQFSLSGASYAVNLHHVSAISKTGVHFTDGSTCSPPRRTLPQLRKKWLHYWQADLNEDIEE